MPQTQLQTADIQYAPWQTIPSGEQTVLGEIICSQLLQVDFGIFFGLDSATTPTGLQILFQKSLKTTGNDSWITIDRIITPTIAPTAIATDSIEVSGSTVIECGTSVPIVGDMILFKNAIITNSEIRTVKSRVTTGGSESVTLMEALTYTQSAGTYYTQAQKYARSYLTFGSARMRIVMDNAYAPSSPSAVFRIDQLNTNSIQRISY